MGDRFHGYTLTTGRRVTVNKGRRLKRRWEWRSHAENFEWGSNGAGAAQLALAMLAHCCTKDFSLRNYQRFKREVIAQLEGNEWYIDVDEVREWAAKLPDRIQAENYTQQRLFELAIDQEGGAL